MMILSSWIFKKFNWGVAALITPIMLATTGILFFALVLCSEPLTPMLAGIGLTPLLAAVLVGAAQNVFSKGAKYALFDPCKEMAYIPLEEEVCLLLQQQIKYHLAACVPVELLTCALPVILIKYLSN